jgi:hypothetical protein
MRFNDSTSPSIHGFAAVAVAVLVACATGNVDGGVGGAGGAAAGGGGAAATSAGGAGGASVSGSTVSGSTGSFGEGGAGTTGSSVSTTSSGSSSTATTGAGGAPPTGELICWDMIDNDNDATIDCADLDCAAEPTCIEDCTNGLDDDGEGLIDCADPVCNGLACDANGKLCSGAACTCLGGATESSCTNGVDDDCDGNADCADADCGALPACMAFSKLVVSEYVEGGGNRKAIELFNAGMLSVDLASCSLRIYSNGAVMPSNTLVLSATPLPLPPGGTFVVCNPQGVQPTDPIGIPAAQCSLTSGKITHNGNDAYDLHCNGQIVDFVGALTSATFAADQTLRRKCSVTTGTTMTTSTFDASQWEAALPIDTFTGLAQRACPGAP